MPRWRKVKREAEAPHARAGRGDGVYGVVAKLATAFRGFPAGFAKLAIVAWLMVGCREAPVEPLATATAVVEAGAPTLPPPAPKVVTEVLEPIGPFELVSGQGSDAEPIAYELLEPSNATAKTPLVIALHGMGDRPAGFAKLMRAIGARARYVVARGVLPWGQGSSARQWYENEAADQKQQLHQRVLDLATLSEQLRVRFPEAGEPVLIGFSQGAAVVLQAALEEPDRWRAVVGLSGFITDGEHAKAPTAAYPVLVVAGTEDDRIAPSLSWFAAGKLREAGHADVRKLEFEGGHTVPKDVVVQVRALFDEVFAR